MVRLLVSACNMGLSYPMSQWDTSCPADEHHKMGRIKERTSSDQARLAEGTSQMAQVFRREGDYWTIIYAGTTVRLRDVIGLHHLAHLLAHPNQRLAVEELLAAVEGINCSDAEHACSAVSKRIRDALRRVRERHPTLGYHLRAGITTGLQCMYVPPPERPLTWTR